MSAEHAQPTLARFWRCSRPSRGYALGGAGSCKVCAALSNCSACATGWRCRWDEMTMLPPGASESRAAQKAALAGEPARPLGVPTAALGTVRPNQAASGTAPRLDTMPTQPSPSCQRDGWLAEQTANLCARAYPCLTCPAHTRVPSRLRPWLPRCRCAARKADGGGAGGAAAPPAGRPTGGRAGRVRAGGALDSAARGWAPQSCLPAVQGLEGCRRRGPAVPGPSPPGPAGLGRQARVWSC